MHSYSITKFVCMLAYQHTLPAYFPTHYRWRRGQLQVTGPLSAISYCPEPLAGVRDSNLIRLSDGHASLVIHWLRFELLNSTKCRKLHLLPLLGLSARSCLSWYSKGFDCYYKCCPIVTNYHHFGRFLWVFFSINFKSHYDHIYLIVLWNSN